MEFNFIAHIISSSIFIPLQWPSLVDRRIWSYGNRCFSSTSSHSAECNTILRNLATKNPVPCGKATGRRRNVGNADDLLGDAHDAAPGLIVHARIVEEMEENLSLWHYEKSLDKQRAYEQRTFKADGTLNGLRKWQTR